MAKKINHRGRGLRSKAVGRAQRVAFFSVSSVLSVVFRNPRPEDNKKSLNSLESTQGRSPPFPLHVPIFIIQTPSLLLFVADMHQN